ncbi:phosphotransferase family protein [Pseudonocardia oroxyli]|uniref:Predicted kinase, aminoglycoside phosphotransferase (APT) family n=1 Tax=Pseudonocardia oroxyli TaxID=366584 RepID=A0A1G7ZUN2_PSEOR|nr:phosphotransferase family protein [Pseudonocardia oroxyli]SDH12317.1 Predicted kinase, aminoglycoside phosphotransferase (APT) family [Pseudonocardia oroxyli]
MSVSTDPVPAAALAEWLRAEVPSIPTPVQVRRISGGHSNLTYRITDAAGTDWALRRPPTGGVLATAHDMSREWRFIAALADTPVPVAPAVAYCADHDVLGADFFLMGFVEGVVPGDVEAGAAMPEEIRRAAGLACAEVLAALHAVEPDAVGLGELRRPGSYLERQLRRWHRQAHDSAVEDLALIDEGHRLLVEGMPAVEETTIAHGDYRPGNLSFGPDGSIGAIFDWELATLGEPLADLGYLLASWGRPGDAVPEITSGPTTLPGWPERDEVLARYVERSGRGDRIAAESSYWEAFARWRSACIGAGVYTRYAAGHMGEGAESPEVARTRLVGLEAQARAAVSLLA